MRVRVCVCVRARMRACVYGLTAYKVGGVGHGDMGTWTRENLLYLWGLALLIFGSLSQGEVNKRSYHRYENNTKSTEIQKALGFKKKTRFPCEDAQMQNVRPLQCLTNSFT